WRNCQQIATNVECFAVEPMPFDRGYDRRTVRTCRDCNVDGRGILVSQVVAHQCTSEAQRGARCTEAYLSQVEIEELAAIDPPENTPCDRVYESGVTQRVETPL